MATNTIGSATAGQNTGGATADFTSVASWIAAASSGDTGVIITKAVAVCTSATNINVANVTLTADATCAVVSADRATASAQARCTARLNIPYGWGGVVFEKFAFVIPDGAEDRCIGFFYGGWITRRVAFIAQATNASNPCVRGISFGGGIGDGGAGVVDNCFWMGYFYFPQTDDAGDARTTYYYQCSSINFTSGYSAFGGTGYGGYSPKPMGCIAKGGPSGGQSFAGSGYDSGSDYNVATDTTAPGSNSLQSQSGFWTNAALGSEDLSLTDGATWNIVDRSGFPSDTDTDIVGTSRPSTGADAGVWQTPAAGGDFACAIAAGASVAAALMGTAAIACPVAAGASVVAAVGGTGAIACAVSAGASVSAAVDGGTVALPIADDFTGTNGSDINNRTGTPPGAQNAPKWVTEAGAGAIDTNTLSFSTYSFARVSNVAPVADLDVWVTAFQQSNPSLAAGGAFGVDGGNYMIGAAYLGQVRLFEQLASAGVAVVAGPSGICADGDEIRTRKVGNAISILVNGVSQLTYTLTGAEIAAFAAVYPGAGAVNGGQVDNFNAAAPDLGGFTCAIAAGASVAAAVGGSGALACAVAAGASVAIALQGSGALACAAAGVASVSASLGGSGAIACASTGSASCAIALTGTGAIACAVSATCSVVCDVGLPSGGFCAIVGSSSVSVSLGGTGALAATIAGSSSVSASLGGTGAIACAAAGAGSVVVSLTGVRDIVCAIEGVGTVSIDLQERVAFAVQVLGTASVAAELTGTGSLACSIVGRATVTCTLERPPAAPGVLRAVRAGGFRAVRAGGFRAVKG